MTDAPHPPGSEGLPAAAMRLELYVAGDTLSSRRAIANLEDLLRRHGWEIPYAVIDVLKDPQAAFRRGIFGTPSLISEVGDSRTLVLGDLSDPEPVVRSLCPRRA
jgi:hypothetical protein